jgi:hypothetical protein
VAVAMSVTRLRSASDSITVNALSIDPLLVGFATREAYLLCGTSSYAWFSPPIAHPNA